MVNGLREFRSWSERHSCQMAQDANYPFAMEKYPGMSFERKGRVNSNLQDFRHECQVRGGQSKCHICEDIDCKSDALNATCFLQLQGVPGSNMSANIPTASDTAWAVGGAHRRDWGGAGVTHYCVFLTGNTGVTGGTGGVNCGDPSTTDYTDCRLRCFGYLADKVSSPSPAVLGTAENRTIIDFHDGMQRWSEDGQVDLWQYPRNCDELSAHQGTECTHAGNSGKQRSFNPQGFTFTHAGNGTAGFADGDVDTAMFRAPDDVVADKFGWLYVADTMNNAIRMIDPATGMTTTLAGKGASINGPNDGDCADATFTEPRGLDVEIREDGNGVETTVIVIADTGNHRIRRIDYIRSTGSCIVSCFSGLCGNNTLSFTQLKTKATPYSGYADGLGNISRFSAPEGVAFMDDHYVVVADTGNFLIRWIHDNGTTATLAGEIVPGLADSEGNPAGGCPPPCLEGKPGFRDGNLSYARFLNPVDVTRGVNNSVLIADEHRIRMVELPNVNTTFFGKLGMGRVSTLVGTGFQGHEDGLATEDATIFNPSGVFMTADSRTFFVDSASCRVRRLTGLPQVAQYLQCEDTPTKYIRPSGCSSFDQPTDKVGRKVTRMEANLQYNYGDPHSNNTDMGKFIKNCVGSPPLDYLDKRFVLKTGDNLVVDDDRYEVDEDSEAGMSMLFYCPASCNQGTRILEGTHWYSEHSYLCAAGIHDGLITGARGGFLRATFQRRAYLNTTERRHYAEGSTNFLTSLDIPAETNRVFTLSLHTDSDRVLHTVGGAPAADLESGCGFLDQQPATLAYFNKPKGITARPNVTITDDEFLYIADTANNRIRGLSAVCTQICENGGTCIGSDTCGCTTGWTGIDCTEVASDACSADPCGSNEVCTSPGSCTCKPGYSGAGCDVPLCVQECNNGGTCTAPDTCTCQEGWYDSNCTTPVCPDTCANGGNCTAPNTCVCPAQWSGDDCRTPVCTQTCQNNGTCVAPDTCICPPQWINYDCSVPVCTQGFFKPNPSDHKGSTGLMAWPTYRQCNREQWCNWTMEFECEQQRATFDPILVPYGAAWRNTTGRKEAPVRCMNIELPVSFKLPFELAKADGNSTGVRRYSPVSPYESDDRNVERGFLYPTEGRTGPWEYRADRQVANVEWLNISQGVYVCANDGDCVSPGVCQCAEGWMGFDCRTPICEQGYYFGDQTNFVSGEESDGELEAFREYMDTNNTYNLSWPYSNPDYSMQWETYVNESYVHREYRTHGNLTYLLLELGDGTQQYQGGYRCSIRSWTDWENLNTLFDHPNYYSRYMDNKVEADGRVYTHWVNMSWTATYARSRVLDKQFMNLTYGYTDEGWRRLGIWGKTGDLWKYGRCITQFQRNCTDPSKQFDLQSKLYDKIVQDPDLSYRPRISFTDERVVDEYGSRWVEAGGECVDMVLRGCYNNGTCIAPGACRCADGWSGASCTEPICSQTCQHNGNCTQPDTCTCERGWVGSDCSEPVCAQDCLNDGVCVAPDTCQCYQWRNNFRDGRQGGGKPLYQDQNGDPIATGWTGYDCSVPICVQASAFYVNVGSASRGEEGVPGYYRLGGHGGDNLLDCVDTNGVAQPRCPQYDYYVTGNDGATYQGGCGYDPYDTGCCMDLSDTNIECYSCPSLKRIYNNQTYYCDFYDEDTGLDYEVVPGLKTELDKFAAFLDENNHFKMCGAYHSPRYHDPQSDPRDYGVVQYYTDFLDRDSFSNRNYLHNLTSNRFLCNVRYWEQGDYVDSAGFDAAQGLGTIHGLDPARHYRINYANMVQQDADTWTVGETVRGEGVFACSNSGSCLAPDLCSCTDGYEGFDCNTPLCRHLQPDGTVSSCSNGGICESKDACDCVRVQSMLVSIYPQSPAGVTGWTGSDCTIPMCIQGFYDPFCTDLPEAPAGQGCYRCGNGGNCTAPDVCTCAEGWSGFDCKTPLCEVVADPLTRTQLGSIFEDKIIEFETDPCGVESIYGQRGWKGRKYARGNCTEPNICTCLCKESYDEKACTKVGLKCDGPWQDPMVSLRDVVSMRGAEYTFGSSDCYYGYEGNVNEMDQFVTCHQTIYRPGTMERYSVEIIAVLTVLGFVIGTTYYFVRARLRQKFILAKIERRRSKRSSEESLLGTKKSKRSTRRSSAE